MMICDCGKKTETPFCAWCGRPTSDVGSRLLDYLESRQKTCARQASTRKKHGHLCTARDDEERQMLAENHARTVARWEAKAEEMTAFVEWVRARMGAASNG
jgi:hypothetical protein